MTDAELAEGQRLLAAEHARYDAYWLAQPAIEAAAELKAAERAAYAMDARRTRAARRAAARLDEYAAKCAKARGDERREQRWSRP